MKNILCLLGFHKWGFEHWGIQICQRPDCAKVDTHRGTWGQIRLNAEKEGALILTIERARKHWQDLEFVRLDDMLINDMQIGGTKADTPK